MRFLHTRLVLRVAAIGFALALVAAPEAMAQTDGYPGTPTTVAPQPTSDERNLGPVEVSGSINITFVNFQPNSTVKQTITSSAGLNSAISPDVVTNGQGSFSDRIEVLPNLVALGGSPLNPLAATNYAQTASRVQVSVNGQTFTVGPYGTNVTVTASGTGVNGQPRSASVTFSVARRGTVTRSGLVRTGVSVLKWAPVGAGLVGAGYLLMLAARRRRAAEI